MTYSTQYLTFWSRNGVVLCEKLLRKFRESCGFDVRKKERKVALKCNKSLSQAKHGGKNNCLLYAYLIASDEAWMNMQKLK